MRESLCWSCKNACGGCKWSMKNHEPIAGWKAIKGHIRGKNGDLVETYMVLTCPQFQSDTPIRISINEVAALAGVGVRSIYRYGLETINELLADKGIRVVAPYDGKLYLEILDGGNYEKQ